MKKIGNTYFSITHGHTVRILEQTGGVWYRVSRTDSPEPLADEVHEQMLTQPWLRHQFFPEEWDSFAASLLDEMS